ncbi:DsbA family protein [Candidatus Protochlamydia sp. R18]|uniref:DsbA family protein n=1 Tax=Candidatus Protochlamydia sp. R18 TaxID=1353977 RepID=UPI0005AB1AD2|nr:thioredoxin domain-containing protein [Candidatus Protochlamydia sp. R18]
MNFHTFKSIALHFIFSFFLLMSIDLTAKEEICEKNLKQRVVLGKSDSPIEIYIVSDWFCRSCKKLEPRLENLYDKFKNKAAFYFIDYPINRQSSNFSPYHLSFLIFEKKNYLKARQALICLTKENQKPTDSDVEKIAKCNKLNFQELAYEDISKGIDFFDSIVKKYQINATPSVIVVNKNNKQFEIFKGGQAKEEAISEAIDVLEGKAKPKKKSWFKSIFGFSN